MTGESIVELTNDRNGRVSEEALFALLRLSVQPLELVQQVEEALELIGGWSWLGLREGGCVYLRGETDGELRAIARCGIASTLMLAPEQIRDDPRLWEAEMEEGVRRNGTAAS